MELEKELTGADEVINSLFLGAVSDILYFETEYEEEDEFVVKHF